MLAWLTENMATIIICAVLIAVVSAIIISMIKNKKKGRVFPKYYAVTLEPIIITSNINNTNIIAALLP